MTPRSALDAAIARLLADALVRELRQELTVQNDAAGAEQSDTAAGEEQARTDDHTDKRLPRAS
jgi:hypothetical protein